MDLDVRPATDADAALMVRWAEAMAFETEGKQLDDATVAGEPAGTLMLTPEWSDWRDGWWWWIQSVYVAPAHRRKGVYRALYSHVLAQARADSGVCGLRLYVERENTNAQRTYEFLGMVDAGYRMYEADTRKG